MVVRLKDIRDGNEDGSTNGIVRLSDLRGTSSQEHPKMTRQQFSSLTGIKTAIPTVNDVQAFKQMQENPLPITSYNPEPQLKSPLGIVKQNIKSAVGGVKEALDAGKNFADSASNAMSFGLTNKLLRSDDEIQQQKDTLSGKAGNFFGEFAPIGGAYKLAGAATRGILKDAPRLVGNIVRGGVAGGIYGTTKEASDMALNPNGDPLTMSYLVLGNDSNKKSLTDRAVNIGKDAALFAAGDAALGLAGAGLKKFAGTKIGESLTNLLKRRQTVAPEAEQQTKQLINMYRSPAGPQTADEATNGIMQEVSQRITPPLENPKLLNSYLETHLPDVPKNEIHALNYNDKAELAGYVRDNLNVHEIARQVSKEKGFNWDELSKNAKIPEPVPVKSIETPIVNSQNAVVTPKTGVLATGTQREYGTLTSLKESPKTNPELLNKLGEKTDGIYTVKTNEQTIANANKVLNKKGTDEAKSYFMNKKTMLKSDDVALGYRLMDEYTKVGDHDSAADIALKLMQSNLEGGRSIQANAIYNRLTPEGALRVASKVYNNGIESIAAQKAIPANVAEQITSATVKMQQASGNKALAQDVIGILDKAKRGEKLTEAETSQLKQFAQEAKKFVPDSVPRKRDKLVEYTSSRADAARKRLESSRNLGFAASKKGNPIVDYAIIGVDHMVKGAVRFADYAEAMAKEAFGKNVNMDEAYVESWKRYKQLNKLKTSDFERIVNQAITEKGLSDAQIPAMKRMAIELSQLEGSLQKEALGELQQAFNALKTTGIGEKASSILRTAQLGNARTMLRNEVSNNLFYALDTLRRKFIATPIDLVTSWKGNRQVFFKNNPSAWNQYFKDWMEGYRAGKAGINPAGLETQYDLGNLAFNPSSKKITDRVGSFLERQVGAFMKASDYAAANRAISTETYQLARAKAYSEGFRGSELARKAEDYFYMADDKIAEAARKYGEYMTFQDKNFLSDAAMKVKETLNLGKDFGMGNIFFNYPKTPANIFMRAVDYSPLGYLRFMKDVGSAVLKKGATKKGIIDAFSRATAGTAMGAIGYYLANIGLLNVLPSKDKNVNSLERSAGVISNSLNINGLIRYVSSFGDPEAAKPRQGDTYASVDWLQPMAITTSTGAALAQAQSPSRLNKGINAADAAIQSLDAAVESASNMSVYKNIKDLFGNSYDSVSDKVGKQIGNAATAFIPSILGQTRNAIDPNYRDTKDENIAMQILKSIENKIPGVSKTIPVRYDTLGQEMKSDFGPMGRVFNSFVNPSLVDKYQPSEAAQIVLDLINKTGEPKLAPNAPSKTFTYKKQTYKFNPDEYRDLQKKVGNQVEQGITKSIDYLKNPNIRDDAKMKRLDQIMNDALEKSKLEYRKLKGIR